MPKRNQQTGLFVYGPNLPFWQSEAIIGLSWQEKDE